MVNCHDISKPYAVSDTGLVEISPSPVAPVCQVGGQLELTCSSMGMIHRWEVTVMMPQTMTSIINILSSTGSVQSPVVRLNSITFTTPRLSGLGSLPLVSRMIITPASGSLNGTVVSCFEGTSSTESVATTTVYIIGGEQ